MNYINTSISNLNILFKIHVMCKKLLVYIINRIFEKIALKNEIIFIASN